MIVGMFPRSSVVSSSVVVVCVVDVVAVVIVGVDLWVDRSADVGLDGVKCYGR